MVGLLRVIIFYVDHIIVMCNLLDCKAEAVVSVFCVFLLYDLVSAWQLLTVLSRQRPCHAVQGDVASR